MKAETVNTKKKGNGGEKTAWDERGERFAFDLCFVFVFGGSSSNMACVVNFCSWRPKISRHFTQQSRINTTFQTRSLMYTVLCIH